MVGKGFDSKSLKRKDKEEQSSEEDEEFDIPELVPELGSDLDEEDDEEEERVLEELIRREEGDLSDSESADNENEIDADDNDAEYSDVDEGEDEDSHFDPRQDLGDSVRLRSLSPFSSDQEDDVTYVTGSDGKLRPIRPEIDPVYDSADSEKEESNTIGNIPISAYDSLPHIGYDIDGKRIMRPATGTALDNLLESIDLPEGWTGLLNKETGKGLNLTSEELDLIKRLQKGENVDDSINPYEATVEWFSSKTEIMPLTATPEPKRRFVPSKHEAKRVMKIVRAIREGRIVPNKPPVDPNAPPVMYDIWADNLGPQADHIMNLRAPQLPPPTHEESYNPPEEYLLTEEEQKEWEATDPQDRERNFLPRKYAALRKVPGYGEALKERFDRSLDLYLAPRVRRNKLNIDPDSLIPELPSPKDLRPFPIKCSTIYRGHVGKVRSVSVDPSGIFLATGGDDGTVRVWEILTGRELWKITLVRQDSQHSHEDNVEVVEWNPNKDFSVLAVGAGSNIYVVVPPGIFDIEKENKSRELIEAGWGYASKETKSMDGNRVRLEDAEDGEDSDDEAIARKKKDAIAKWIKPSTIESNQGVGVVIHCKRTVKRLSWHRKGDYFVTVSPQAANTAVLIHQLSKHTSQSPFQKSKGIVQDARFHPFRPHLYVATQRYVRIYDLAAQILVKKLMPGVRWLSSFDIHPKGDNVITSSYDKRMTWHDLELDTKPYKTLRYHDKAVRDVSFHKGGLPLFCSASDDGHINVFHGSVYDDMMQSPLLVPLKILKGHEIRNSLGILRVTWHPKEAWLFSAGADGTARLWTA